MINIKYQVFISSAYTDLKAERNQVISAVLESGNIPVGMEAFAGTDKQENVIRNAISNSDIYIIILGSRYGSLMEKVVLALLNGNMIWPSH